MSKKLPKQNVQQAFNQFLFDTMMERIWAANLLGQRIDGLRDRMDVFDSQDTHTCHNVAALQEDRRLIEAIQAKMKEQREDYHGHIRQLVTENEAAHIQQSNTILKMQEQIKGLENRLSRAQDMIAECHPDGCIVVKNKKKPVGKIQG